MPPRPNIVCVITDDTDPFFFSEHCARLVENARRRLTVADIGYFHERFW